MNPFFVYILQCSDKSYYVAHTDDLEERIAKHQSGYYAGYTSTRLSIKLVYTQTFYSRDEALVAEQQIKKWKRCKKEALIHKNWEKIKILSKRTKIR